MSDAAHAETPGTDIPGEIEAKARDMGWRPEEEWEGDTKGWMPAEDFIKRQDKRRDIANEEFKTENERLSKELDGLRAEQAETRQTLDEFKGFYTKVEQKAYDRAMNEIQAKQREAVEAGDTDAFDKAAKEQDALIEDAATQPEPKRQTPDDDPAYKAWVKNNGWYKKDARLRMFANLIGPEIMRTERFQGNEPAFYEAVEAAVKEEYPDKFENPNRKKAAAVESSGTGGKPKASGKTAADLPVEVRTTGERFVKQGLFKNIGEYAKDYFAQEE